MTLGSTDHFALYSDRALAGLALARSRSYQSDSEVDLYVSHAAFDFQRRLSSIAVRLRDPFLKCNRNLGWNIDWAVAFIVDRLEKTLTDAAETLENIRIRAATLEREGLIHEIPYRIFNKVDEVLFAGHLKNAVFLDISRLGSDVSGATYTHSWGPNTEVKRVSIILNSDALEYARARDVVAMLIHHMIHAYFLVACGPQKEDEVDYGRLGHGVHFGKIMLAIKKVSAVHGKELTPLGFRHRSAAIRYLAEEYYYLRGRAAVDHEDNDRWYCSHCHCNVEAIPASDIDKWYIRVCKPMFDQPKSIRSADVTVYNDRRHELEVTRRSQLIPSAKSVEFILKGKPILVETKKINDFLSVRKAFDKARSRYLKVPKDVSETTFLRFLEYLHTGSYRPDPRPFAAAAANLGGSRTGPPIIKPQITNTEAPLLADIQLAKLGSLMDFDECKTYALQRMNTYGILYEDPVALLTEIYTGQEPDPDLKTWARKFLIQAPAKIPSNDEYISSPTLSTLSITTAEPPNLIKLESEHSAHRARFIDAMEASGALENDVNKARAELKSAGWYDWSSFFPRRAESGLLRAGSRLPLRYETNPPFVRREVPSLLFNSTTSLPMHEWFRDSSSSSLGVPPSLSHRDIERLRDLDQDLGLDLEQRKLLSFERESLLKNLDRERLRVVERERERDRDRERDRVLLRGDFERETEKLDEVKMQVQAKEALERWLGVKERGGKGEGEWGERYLGK